MPTVEIAAAPAHVPESRFGVWFLGTAIWTQYVLDRALDDLERLIPMRRGDYPVVVDVGCGFGHSFKRLKTRFAPERLVGVDIAPEMIAKSARAAARDGLKVELLEASNTRLPLLDQSVDLLFCHQTFHHLVHQHQALAEFHRVLKPGGLLLFSESTRRYIHSWIIRLLFRHPMDVQRTAPEYLKMIGDSGFEIAPECVSYPFLWWSRPDLGIAERLLKIKPPRIREETMINVVAVRGL